MLCLVALPLRADDYWQAHVQQRIANEEYRITRQDDRFHAANRSQNLRAYFCRDGATILRRASETEPWQLGMQLIAVGREGAMKSAGAVEPVLGRCERGAGPGATAACLRRLEYQRPDVGVIEWYANKREGMEQGFDVYLPYAGPGPLRLEIKVSGATVRQEGENLTLLLPSGGSLRFGSSKAADRRLLKLPVRLLSGADRFVVEVDDRRARYPITIDPLLTDAQDASDPSLVPDRMRSR